MPLPAGFSLEPSPTSAPQAEFTPRNVQTKEERVNTVFAVRIGLANADLALKPGMPAKAALTRQPGD